MTSTKLTAGNDEGPGDGLDAPQLRDKPSVRQLHHHLLLLHVQVVVLPIHFSYPERPEAAVG